MERLTNPSDLRLTLRMMPKEPQPREDDPLKGIPYGRAQ